MQIYIKTLTGKTFTFEVDPLNSVESLKLKIKNALFPDANSKLKLYTFQGTLMDYVLQLPLPSLAFQDNDDYVKSDATLGECNIANEDTLYAFFSEETVNYNEWLKSQKQVFDNIKTDFFAYCTEHNMTPTEEEKNLLSYNQLSDRDTLLNYVIANSSSPITSFLIQKGLLVQDKNFEASQLPDHNSDPSKEKKLTKADIYNNKSAHLVSVETLGVDGNVIQDTPSSENSNPSKAPLDVDEKAQKDTLLPDNSNPVEEKKLTKAYIYDNKGKVSLSSEKLGEITETGSFLPANSNNEEMNLLITKKLVPLIHNYQKILIKKENNLSETELKKLTTKQDILNNLLEHLTKEQPNASDKVKLFYTELNKYELELGAHRDPDWKRFVKNAVICGGILITGILPGLIALVIYTTMDKNAPRSMQFWNSQGKNFVDKALEERPQDLEENPSLTKNK